MRKQDIVALIPLTQNKIALVSPEDYERARSHLWHTVTARNGKVWYAHSRPLGLLS